MKAMSGIDLVEIDRFRQLNPEILRRFLERVFTFGERTYIAASFEKAAGLFCAKEAAAKALGCGIGPVSWQELEITHTAEGNPQINLHGNARRLASRLGIISFSVSISHTRQYATAVALALGSAQEGVGIGSCIDG